MAYSFDNFNSVGATVCNLTYPFLLRAHIKVYKARDLLAGTGTLLSETTHYTWTGASQITLGTAIASGEVVTVERQTPNTAQLSPWTDGSNLTAEALNNADLQNLYVVQEQQDKNDLGAAKSISASNTATTASNDSTTAVNAANAALPKAGGSMTGAIAMGTNKITGVGDPTAAQDAVTKAYLERTGSIQSAQIQDGTLVNNDVNASAAIAQSKLDIANATTSASGYMSAADKTHLDSCDVGAKDNQTASEIKALVDSATDSNVYTDAEKSKLAGCDIGSKDDQTASEIRALVESANDSNVFTDTDHSRLNAMEDNSTADQTAGEIKTAYESNAQTNPLTDAEKSVIDGVTANTSEINALDGYTGNTTNLNIVAGKSFRASTDGALSTTSDTEMPSSKVVAAHVAAQIGTVGGFTTIANDASFPATASQPANGVIISISDAQGVAVSGTTSTTGRTVDGTPATVTINNFPSSLTGETLASGVGLLVTSTGSGNIYNYHKLLAAESDVKQLSDDINDFNSRYRVASSAPGSNNDDGDLWFDATAKKMKVYNGTTSQFDDVASVGSFYVNTISSSSGTGGGSATFNGSAYRFTLSNAGTSAQQHIVSVNGVIQKPNSGTSQPSEGFAISGNDIIFSAAPASGSDSFIITCGSSVSIGTPSANSVNSSHIIDGSIVDGDISNSANIAVGKLQMTTGHRLLGIGGSGSTVQEVQATGNQIADDGVNESKLNIHNAPATDKYLKYTSNGMEWSDGASEGTDVKSTGESGTAKFLRVDGDGTCSWQTPPDTNTQVGGATGVDFNDNVEVRLGTGNDLKLFHDGSNSRIEDTGTGRLFISSDLTQFLNAAKDETTAEFIENGACQLYFANVKRIETTSSGINVTGQINVNGSALSAAPEVSLVADGAIAQHDSCIIQSDGKVGKVAVSSAVLGSEAVGPDSSTSSGHMASCWDIDNERIIAFYQDGGDNKGYIRMGSLSGTTITWLGTAQEVFSNCEYPCINYIGSNRVVMTTSYSGYCGTRFATVNVGNNNFTVDNVTKQWGGHMNGCDHTRQDYDSSNGVIGFSAKCPSNSNYIRACFFKDDNFSSVNDSYAVRTLGCTFPTMTYDPSANRWVVIYARSGTRSIVLNLNNSISVSNNSGEKFWALRQYEQLDSLYHAPTKRVLCVFRGQSQTNRGLGCVAFDVKAEIDNGNERTHTGEADNNNIHAPNLVAISDNLTSTAAYGMNDGGNKNFVYNSVTEKFVVNFHRDQGAGQGSFFYDFTFNSVNDGFTAGTAQEYSGDSATKPMSLVLAGSKRIVLYVKTSSEFQKYRVDSPAATNLTATNFIGFATAAISDTATGAIAVTGNTTTKSSLSAGNKYYVQINGTLGTTAGNLSVEAGIALSSTKLLIKG